MSQLRDPIHSVAVVGLGAALPGADDPEAFFRAVAAGQSQFREATAADFGADPRLFYEDAEGPLPDKTFSLQGAWKIDRGDFAPSLAELKFPASFDLAEADRSLAYFLESGRQALQGLDLSGHDPKQMGVIAGHVVLPTRAMAEATVSLYGKEATRSWSLNPFGPPPRSNPFRTVGYSAKLLAEAYGFQGPAFTVDAACASSLYALALASAKLLSGSLTFCLAGGLSKADPLFTQLGFSQLRALSRQGVARPFEARADGLVVGTGAACFALKRLDRALADGDRVHALILGVGLSNDLRANPLAPDVEGQGRAMARARTRAGESYPPGALLGDLGFIEAHGSATPVGDAAEVKALKEFLRSAPYESVAPPVLSAVKSNIGHLLSAAAAASLLKTILALREKKLLPMANFRDPHPDLQLESEPRLRILTETEPWPEPREGRSRLALVNAFGFGGVNAQAVLEEYLPDRFMSAPAARAPQGPRPPLRATLISARTVLAPWPNYESLARYWLTPDEPPMARDRRVGRLKATGFFFEELSLDATLAKIPPLELLDALPQQTLALKVAFQVMKAAGLSPAAWPESLPKDRVGVFMGINNDPRAADYATRWLAPRRAVDALIAQGYLKEAEAPDFLSRLLENGPAPLTHAQVLGALGSFVASRLSRWLGTGGPSFTLSEEKDAGLRALREAIHFLEDGAVDLAFVGVVDTFGDPKTAALAPRTIWVEGAAGMLLASPKGREILPPLAELKLSAPTQRLGPLSALFNINRSGFYLRHHLKPLGPGKGFCYWLKNPEDEARELSGPGFALAETPGSHGTPLTVPPEPIRPETWFFLRAEGEADLRANLSSLLTLAEKSLSPHEFLTLGARFHARRDGEKGAPALSILARSGHELMVVAKKVLAGEKEDRDPKPRFFRAPPAPLKGELALVYPGAGNHYKGLGRNLGLAFPDVVSVLENETERPRDVFQAELFWEPNKKTPSVREGILAQAVFAILATRVLAKLGLKPDAALGYSLGEATALVANGFWRDRDAIHRDLLESPLFNSELTGELRAPKAFWNWPDNKPLKYLAVVFPKDPESVRVAREKLAPSLARRVFPLLVNTPTETVAGGEEAAVQALAAALDSPYLALEDAPAIHSPVVTPVLEEYRAFHSRAVFPQEGTRIYSSHAAAPLEQTTEAIAESLTLQALHGHHFPNLINRAYADGVRLFLEVGPGGAATRAIRAILGDRPHLAQSLAATPVDEGWSGIARALSDLWLAGYPISPLELLPQPQPRETGDLLVPIKLAPAPLLWPEPPALKLAPAPIPPAETPRAAPLEDDYLAWLQNETGLKRAPAAPSPSQGQAQPLGAGQAADLAPPPPAPRVPSPLGPRGPKPGTRTVEIPPKPARGAGGSRPGLRTVEISPLPPGRRWDSSRDSGGGRPFPSAAPPFPPSPKTSPAAPAPRESAPPASAPTAPAEARRETGEWEDRFPLARDGFSYAPPGPIHRQREIAAPTPAIAPDSAPRRRGRPKGSTKKSAQDPSLSLAPPNSPVLSRAAALEFAVGSVAKVFGEEFRAADSYPSRVRLPAEPLMFVDRVLALQGEPKSLSEGRVVTEHDIRREAWYLVDGRLTPGLIVESGQADLLLCSYLGMDFATLGLSKYRLLDAEVIYHRDPPLPGETTRYDIRINKFFQHADTRMFRFDFEGSVDGVPLLTMSKGCAGFFTQEALEGGKGLSSPTPEISPLKGRVEPSLIAPDAFAGQYPRSLGPKALEAIREGDLSPLGVTFGRLAKERPLATLPSGRLSLIDSVPSIDRGGGAYGLGFIRAEARIDPRAWYLTCHFVGDEVMPGTLMYDASLQAFRLYLLSLGWLGERGQAGFFPGQEIPTSLKCRGQVTPKTRMVAYDIHIKEISFLPRLKPLKNRKPGRPTKPPLEPMAKADAIMWADGRPIVEVRDLCLVLAGGAAESLKEIWENYGAAPGASKGKSAAPAPAASKGDKNGRHYPKEKLLSLSTGKISDAFGPLFSRFDGGEFVARLPQAPFDFMDSVEVLQGRMGEVAVGSQIESKYLLDPQKWYFAEAGGARPTLPYSVLNEIGLQPCGFLAAYMGSALPFPGPMHFRNLGGEATLYENLAPTRPLEIVNVATLSKASVLGDMTIQHYEFTVSAAGRKIYEGKTHFGFLSPENLAKQEGLKLQPARLKRLTELSRPQTAPYPRGASWPRGKLRMVDWLQYDPPSLPGALQRIQAKTRVNPGAWFFAAHFPQDPVWPGSLGLEAFIQTAKALAAINFRPSKPLKDLAASFLSPLPGQSHAWLYRGQIAPLAREIKVAVEVKSADPDQKTILFQGVLFVDDLPIYQIENFTLALT